jgi:hypothetical protein
MNKESIVACALVSILFAAVGFAIGSVFGISLFSEKFQRDAIRKGHAMWSTDENGHPVFQWKEASK